jgi:hypothetical protein
VGKAVGLTPGVAVTKGVDVGVTWGLTPGVGVAWTGPVGVAVGVGVLLGCSLAYPGTMHITNRIIKLIKV